MASSHGFFTPRHLYSSNAFSTTNHIGSNRRMLSIQEQQRLMLEMQQHNTLMEQERLRQPPVPTFSMKKLKRKTMTTEVPPGPSTDVVLDSTRNVFFNFDNNYQEAQKHIAKKKNTSMTVCLSNENDADDAEERAAKEIPFFPLSSKHGLPSSESEFSAHEMSSMFGGGSDVELDLSLKLSSPNGESGLAMDLSLKL
ncbi:unnamed protein product [Urochloa decumbens]|uniref:Uncharacterized protein n=1 Tax=Urochloa decumbens TaxID=240449 RepID=A0ABC8ZJK8_9POAL